MKKKIAMLMTMMFVLGTFSINAFASEKDVQDSYDIIIEEIKGCPEENSGIYFKDNVLHIIPTEGMQESLDGKIRTVERNKIEYVIDEPARYSAADLQEAFATLREQRDNLNITGYAINYENNQISIMAPEWTDAEKENIKGLLDIENIEFISEGYDVKFDVYDDMDIEKNSGAVESHAKTEAKLGFRMMVNDNPDINYTIGRAVEDRSGNVYYLTAGHGLATNDKMEIISTADPIGSNNYVKGFLGNVSHVKVGGNVDAALVKNGGSFLPTTETRNGVNITRDGKPQEGVIGTVWTYGGPVYVLVKGEVAELKWDGKWFNDLIEMTYRSTGRTGSGDSGSCISTMYNDDYSDQRYVGIYKGRKELSDGTVLIYGINRTSIEDAFNVSSY